MDLITILITSHVRIVWVFFSIGVTSKESSKGNSKRY